MANKKLKLEDLYIGMKIKDKSQLDEIYDTWIIMYRNKEEEYWTIGFIGKETNKESDKITFGPYKFICPVYNNSMDLDEDLDYDF